MVRTIRTSDISRAAGTTYVRGIEKEARSASSSSTAPVSGRQTVVLANGETDSLEERCTWNLVRRGRGAVMFTLVRWNNKVINAKGPLGDRLRRRYIAETARLLDEQRRVALEWSSYR